jgi:CRP/FNR family transcriptional regulator, cyclic AMP receptor protein
MSMSNVEALRQSVLFASLADDDVEKLSVRLRRLRYGPGHVIFEQGDQGVSLYIVTDGEVRIGLESAPGTDVIPTLVRAGEAFGEMAVLDGHPRSATATTTTDTELLMLSRDDFLALLDADPEVVRAVLRALAEMIRRTNERLGEVLLSVHTRMARRLLDLADAHGLRRDDGILIDREVTDAELAGLTGLHRVEVERILANYQYDDIIRMEFGRILIRQPETLLAWVHTR